MVPRPKILMIGSFLSATTGIRSVGEELGDRLSSAGYQVIFTSGKAAKLARILDMVTTIIKERDNYDIAYVEVYSGPAFIWAYVSTFLLKLFRKKLVLTLHGGNLPKFSLKFPTPVRRLLAAADKVTAPSQYLLSEMKRYREELILLPNAIQLEKYPFILRENLRPIVIWLRAFHKIYNPNLAVLACSSLVKKYPDLFLYMIGPDKGDGSYKNTKSIASQYQIEKNIEFTGRISKKEIAKWLNKGDIFLNTTNYDNTPISVIEAMACGLCVVSTNVGGIPFLLDSEKNALLVPPNNPHAMATAVKRVIEEPGLAEKLSRNARLKAEQYDWSVILPQWERLIESIS